jgi:cytochrome c peroxidase
MRVGKLLVVATCVFLGAAVYAQGNGDRERDNSRDSAIDRSLAKVLKDNGFTGDIDSQLETRLGRQLNKPLANLGRLLWFDTIHSLHHDNTCGGCHSPTNGFGDTQSIAIGVDNNNLVGPHRTGPRNQRRTPLMVNTAFYPKMMWNGRFSANHPPAQTLGDPFSNRFGFHFPPPEDDVRFPPNDPVIKVLLQAQGEIPPTETVEVAGFTGTCPGGHASEGIDQRQCVFDNGIGDNVPLPDPVDHSRNEPIRQKALQLLNANRNYRTLFGNLFPAVAHGGPIDFDMFGLAIAEFEFSQVYADAPLDQFARGDRSAMTAAQKRGALVFFDEDRGKCITCHATKGRSNQMFSDFENRVAGIPQIAPVRVGVGITNMIYDGPGQNEDFGLEQISGDSNDRYKFRTAPLRNLALSPAFFHNGSFTSLDSAIRFHLDAERNIKHYDAKREGVAADLTKKQGPVKPVIDRLDPILVNGIHLTDDETDDLVEFVKYGLLDDHARKENLCKLVPSTVPSGRRVLEFEACQNLKSTN